jgi:hypothetical protein
MLMTFERAVWFFLLVMIGRRGTTRMTPTVQRPKMSSTDGRFSDLCGTESPLINNSGPRIWSAAARDSEPGCRTLTSLTAYRKHDTGPNTLDPVRHLRMVLVLFASHKLINCLGRSLILRVRYIIFYSGHSCSCPG